MDAGGRRGDRLAGPGAGARTRRHQILRRRAATGALGRMLVRGPRCGCWTSRLAHLDPARKSTSSADICTCCAAVPPTILLVTHDPVEALTLGQRLAVLRVGAAAAGWNRRPTLRPPRGPLGGRVARLAPDEPHRRRPRPCRGRRGPPFRRGGRMAFHLPVPAELVTHGAEGQPVTVGIRPDGRLQLTPRLSLPTAWPVLPGWTWAGEFNVGCRPGRGSRRVSGNVAVACWWEERAGSRTNRMDRCWVEVYPSSDPSPRQEGVFRPLPASGTRGGGAPGEMQPCRSKAPTFSMIVNKMHREKNIPKEVIFEGIEAALQLAAERAYGGTEADEDDEPTVAVTIDRADRRRSGAAQGRQVHRPRASSAASPPSPPSR